MSKIVLIFSLGLLFSCSHKQWYRGNTHVHTVLCGHADSSPETVTKWYHDHGYNFLVLSEHNKFIDPTKVKLPIDKRKDFILIPGQEITSRRHIHSTAMNITRLIPWGYSHRDKHKEIQRHVDDTQAVNGVNILNHPTWHNAVAPQDVFPVKRLYMFELFNTEFHKIGPKYPSDEIWWDRMLTQGLVMYGVGGDDAHQFKRFNLKDSNPGRGWVMVRSASLNANAITAAMWNGDFYTSTGVYLQKYKVTDDEIFVKVDVKSTLKNIETKIRNRKTNKVINEALGFKIELIGEKGKILQTIRGLEGKFKITKKQSYYRVKISYVQKHPARGLEGYYAWCQPVFTDGRVEKLQILQHEYLKDSHEH